MGHALNYTSTDIVARFKKLRGYNVLHPIGYDAFGLPAEQYAVEHGVHPEITTNQNIDAISRQLKRLGLSFDWGRVLSTTDVDYYKWTQWIFLQLYNSYFDEDQEKAVPISELVSRLDSGELLVDEEGKLVSASAASAQTRSWSELNEIGRENILAEYRLAFLGEVPVNWCPALGTVLANEEVTNEGRSERGNHPVFKRPLKQWMLRITKYCERLLADLDLVNWPEPTKMMQRNWIGRSEGANVDFALEGRDDVIRVFTTRPDTLFGATYMVLAPEHPLVQELTVDEQQADVDAYVKSASEKTDLDRQIDSKEKTGVFTGAYAINPVNGEKIPVWIADYVMMGYGTGAIMAVPGHDERDHAFATAFKLPIIRVVDGGDVDIADAAFTGVGNSCNSANDEVSLNGLATPEAKRTITKWLECKGLGEGTVQYKLRDWLFSRQRYWGEPFPILHGPDGQVVAVDEADLPVALPEMEDFKPSASDDPDAPPRPPLGRAPESWRIVEKDGVKYERELNTMPQWAGSCWYYLRFCDAKNDERFASEDAERYWMDGLGVDLYIGGVEHAVLHLLYARFWHKVLYDLGHVSTPEPFGWLFNQGYIQAAAYRDERGVCVEASEVEEKEGEYSHNGAPVTREFGKMGKSLKNSVDPTVVCEEYGADTLRLYLMYMGPLDQSKPWEMRDIVGPHRFIQRVWRNLSPAAGSDDEGGGVKGERVVDRDPTNDELKSLHKTIARVTDDMERLGFNTAIAALIELNNDLTKWDDIPRAVAEPFLVMLTPLAPHVAEEIWSQLGHEELVSEQTWPEADKDFLVEDECEIAVQILGKVRSRITVPADADNQALESAALSDEKIASLIEGKTVRKVIVVPGKLVNIVAN